VHKAIIFDFFDVIHHDYQKSWLKERGLKREGGYAEASDLLDVGRIGFQEYLERFAELSGQTAADVAAQFQSLARVDDAVVAIIKKLHANYFTGLVSNAHSEELRPILERHNLADLFHEIIISSDVGVSKPDPAIFHLMLERLGVKPHEAIFIDDNPVNIEGAKKVGLHGICFTSADALRKELIVQGVDVA